MNTPEPEVLPPSLRLLKWLVIVLTVTMILGVITVVGVLVTRMPSAAAPVTMPEQITLPDDVRPVAVTMGRDFVAVVTEDDRILIFGRDGSFRQEVEVIPGTDPTAAPNVQP